MIIEIGEITINFGLSEYTLIVLIVILLAKNTIK